MVDRTSNNTLYVRGHYGSDVNCIVSATLLFDNDGSLILTRHMLLLISWGGGGGGNKQTNHSQTK